MKLSLISTICGLLCILAADAIDPVCYVYGDPHYKTFDCQRIDFQGTGTYLLTSNTDPEKDKFKVSHKITGIPGIPGVTWLQRLYLKYSGMLIRVGPGNILKVNGKTRNIPIDICKPWPKCIHIRRTGTVIKITTDFGLIIEYNFATRSATIQLPGIYRDCVTGLCGNANGNKEDDLNTKDGKPTTGTLNERHRKVGNSYASEKTIAEEKTPQQPFIPPPAPDFADEPMFCGLLISDLSNPFKACLDFHGADIVDQFHQGCVVDVSVVVDGAARAACDILNVLAELCQNAGIAIDSTWRTISNCTVECGADLEYTSSMSPCGHSCTDLAATNCTLPDSAVPEEGCVCPGDTVASGDECVTPDNCGCMLENGVYLKSGEEEADASQGVNYLCNGPNNVTVEAL